MSHDNPSLDIEALLQEKDWLRRLAKGLLRDPERADEAVQDTWLAALEGAPPRASDRRQVRSWLATVLRNRAHDRARAERSRDERVQRLARDRGSELAAGRDDVAETIEALGLRRDIAGAVLSLPESQRDVILLRYLRSFSVAETARRLGLQEGTVRTRCSRGLAELRRRLDTRHGRREGWAIALVRDLQLAPSVGRASAALAPLVFASVGQLALVASLALLAALGLWLHSTRGGEPPSLQPNTETLASSSLDELEQLALPDGNAPSLDADPTEAALRSAVVVEDEAEPEAPSEEPMFTAIARIVDERGRPIEGARLSLSPRLLAGEDGPVALANTNGDVHLPVPRARLEAEPLTLEPFVAGAEGRASVAIWCPLPEGDEKFVGTIELMPGGTVRGRVVDEDGRGLSGVRVTPVEATGEWSRDRLARLELTGERELGVAGLSGPDGEFELEGLPATGLSIQAHAPGYFFVFSPPVVVRRDQVADCGTLRLEPAADEFRVAGHVYAPDGSPAPNVSITLFENTYGRPPFEHTAADGSFELLVDPETTYRLRVGMTEPDQRNLEVHGGDTDLEVHFAARRFLSAKVVGPDGEPAELVQIRVSAADSKSSASFSAEPSGTDEFRVPILDEPFTVSVRAHSCGYSLLGPFDPANLPEQFLFELERAPGTYVQVLHKGQPVAGARVELRTSFQTGSGLQRAFGQYYSYVSPYLRGEARSSSEGLAFLDTRADYLRACYLKELYIDVSADGFARTQVGPIPTASWPLKEPLVVELREGGTVAGRLFGPPGFEARGETVMLSCGDGSFLWRTLTDSDQFEFEHVPPGTYYLQRVEGDPRDTLKPGIFTPFDGPSPFDLIVEAGKTKVRDLVLEGQAPHRFIGRFTIDGETPSDWTWQVGSTPMSPVGSAGDLLGESEEAETVVAFRSPFGACQVSHFWARLRLEGPESTWSRDVETGRVELSGLRVSNVPAKQGDARAPLYELSWTADDGLEWKGVVMCAEDGTALLPQVPAGSVRVERIGADESDKELVAEFELAAGQSITVLLDDE